MGNPDHLEQGRTTEFAGRYDVSDLKEFTITEWETIHTTQGNVPNETDTNYLMPLRSLRELEARARSAEYTHTSSPPPAMAWPSRRRLA